MDQSSGSPISVENGQLNFGDDTNSGFYSTFKLTASAATIYLTAEGSMTLYQTGATLIDNSGNPDPFIYNNGGKVTLQEAKGAFQTGILTPLQNYGTLDVNGGEWLFGQSDSYGIDLYMGTGGTINMNNDATVTCSDNYTQGAGAFNVMDAQETFNVITNAAFSRAEP